METPKKFTWRPTRWKNSPKFFKILWFTPRPRSIFNRKLLPSGRPNPDRWFESHAHSRTWKIWTKFFDTGWRFSRVSSRLRKLVKFDFYENSRLWTLLNLPCKQFLGKGHPKVHMAPNSCERFTPWIFADLIDENRSNFRNFYPKILKKMDFVHFWLVTFRVSAPSVRRGRLYSSEESITNAQ